MRLISLFFTFALLFSLSGCIVASVAVGATTAVVGGVVEAVDIVTPDIIDDDDEEEEDEDKNCTKIPDDETKVICNKSSQRF